MPIALLTLAMEIPDAALWGAVVSIVAAIWGTVKVAATWLAKREETRDKEHADALATKDAQISSLTAQIAGILASKRQLLDQRELTITELSKKLSAKSDETAAIIERLMQMSMTKIEEWSEKDRAMLERALNVMSEFTTTVKRMVGNGDRMTPMPPPAREDVRDRHPDTRDRPQDPRRG